jgi:hypothetical protein
MLQLIVMAAFAAASFSREKKMAHITAVFICIAAICHGDITLDDVSHEVTAYVEDNQWRFEYSRQKLIGDIEMLEHGNNWRVYRLAFGTDGWAILTCRDGPNVTPCNLTGVRVDGEVFRR